MKNKKLEFVKNAAISTAAFFAGGAIGGEISDLVTDNKHAISIASTVTAYLTSYPTFMILHAHDNKDVYKKNGKWDKPLLIKDTFKVMLSFGLAEIAYAFGRTALVDYLLKKAYSPAKSSLYADIVTTPFYYAVAIPIAKKIGLIKDSKKPK